MRAGYFNTGLSVDYRDYNSFAFSAGSLARWQSGLTYNQWMAMILRSMGLQPSEYSTNNGVYGYPSEARGELRAPRGHVGQGRCRPAVPARARGCADVLRSIEPAPSGAGACGSAMACVA